MSTLTLSLLKQAQDEIARLKSELSEKDRVNEIYRTAIQNAIAAKCPDYVAHPQSVWFSIWVQDKLSEALKAGELK